MEVPAREVVTLALVTVVVSVQYPFELVDADRGKVFEDLPRAKVDRDRLPAAGYDVDITGVHVAVKMG